MLARKWRNESSQTLLIEVETEKTVWKTVWQFLKGLYIKLPWDPSIPLLSIFPKELKTGTQTVACKVFTTALLTVAMRWKLEKPFFF